MELNPLVLTNVIIGPCITFPFSSFILYRHTQIYMYLHINIHICMYTLFYSSLRLTAKLCGKYRVPPFSWTHRCVASPTINISHHSGIFITTDEAALIHHHPKSIVHVLFQSWCHMFYVFWQMCNDRYLQLENIEYSLTAQKSTVLHLCAPFPLAPSNHWSFAVSIIVLFQKVVELESYRM